MKYLLISEKPSLMRAVQSAYYKAGLGIEVDFIALHGHCCTLCAPDEYDEKYKNWNLNDLPIIPQIYKHKPVEADLVKEISKKLKSTKYDGLINCTDAEREGQNIFYSLYDYLNLDLPVKRFWASDLTEPKLIEAWKNLRDDLNEPFLKNLTEASLLRAQLDWLIGMNFSRAISISNNENIPIGRVMTVVLAILAKREEDIKNFVPTKSYKLMVDYKEGFTGEYKHDPFKTKEECEYKGTEVKTELIVTEANRNIKTSEAPLLYSLGDLQNDANKEYGYTLNKSLSIIQGLYEAKILSYPRTDCPYLTTGEAKRLQLILDACMLVPDINVKIDPEKVKNYAKSKYVNDKKVQAHYAIVFTGAKYDFNKLTKEQQNILTLVAKRIVATCMDAAKTSEVDIHAMSDDMEFITKENVLTYAGWKSLYGAKVGITSLDEIKKGDKLKLKNAYAKEVVTTCPPRFNDATINKAMINVGSLIEDKDLASALSGKTKDQGGIGTPATRAGIIEKLLDAKKGWVSRKGKNFVVSDTGLDVYHKVKDYSISSPILTAEWESKLKQVEDGELNSVELTTEINSFVNEECTKFSKMEASNSLVCPICGNPIKESQKYFYCSAYKNPCTFIVGKTMNGASISKEDVKKLLEGKETEVKNFKSKKGTKFKAALKLEKGSLQFVFDNQTPTENIICKCGKNISKIKSKNGTFYKCECGTFIGETAFGHKFTKTEIKNLFAGKIIPVDNLVGKSGKAFSANLVIKDHKLVIDSFINKQKGD